MADDFSADNPLSPAELATANLGLEESAHRMRTQVSVFNAVLSFSALMIMAGITIAAAMVYMIARDPKIHWHASILVAAMVVPPTVMMIALLRAVFQAEKVKQEKDETTGLPVQDFVREVIKGVREALKSSHT